MLTMSKLPWLCYLGLFVSVTLFVPGSAIKLECVEKQSCCLCQGKRKVSVGCKGCNLSFVPEGLPQNVSELILDENEIQRLHFSFASSLKELRTVSLDGNPIICDSDAFDFINWAEDNDVKITGVNCYHTTAADTQKQTSHSPLTTSNPDPQKFSSSHPRVRPSTHTGVNWDHTTAADTQPQTSNSPLTTSNPAAYTKECPGNVTEDGKGTFQWKKTPVGKIVYYECPVRTDNETTNAKRECILEKGDAKWRPPDTSQCSYISARTRALEKLAETPVTPENINNISTEIEKVTKQSKELKSEDVIYVSKSLENVIQSNTTLDTNTTEILIASFGNILDIKTDVLVKSQHRNQTATRMVRNIELCAQKLSFASGKSEVVVRYSKLAVAKARPNISSKQDFHFQLIKDGTSSLKDIVLRTTNNGSPEVPTEKIDSSAVIPWSAFENKTRDLYFIVYQNTKLFQAIANTTPRKVIAVGIVGGEVEKRLIVPITVKFGFTEKCGEKVEIAIWNFSKNKGNGGWNMEEVTTEDEKDHYVSGRSYSMGHFGLLFDVYGTGKKIDKVHMKMLSVISFVGWILSISGLLLTLITYIKFQILRKTNSGKILINLCIALLFVGLLFIASTQNVVRTSSPLCKVTAILLHYMLMAAWCWMLVESFSIYLALVKVFRSRYSHFLLKCCLFGWGVPMPVVAITVAVSRDYYIDDCHMCWLRGTAFYVSFLAPVSLILVMNLIAFARVIHQLCRRGEKNLKKSKRTNLTARFRGAVGLTVLLGLPWIFGFFSFGGATTVFSYLFVVVNSLQGLFVFVFFCVLKQDVRQAWWSSCGGRVSGEETVTSTLTNEYRGQGKKKSSLPDSTDSHKL